MMPFLGDFLRVFFFFLICLFKWLKNPSTFWKLRSCNATPQHCWHLEIGSNGTPGLVVFSIVLKPWSSQPRFVCAFSLKRNWWLAAWNLGVWPYQYHERWTHKRFYRFLEGRLLPDLLHSWSARWFYAKPGLIFSFAMLVLSPVGNHVREAFGLGSCTAMPQNFWDSKLGPRPSTVDCYKYAARWHPPSRCNWFLQ